MYVTFLAILCFFCAKSIVFLPQIADDHRDKRDKHLTRRRIPTEGLHAYLEAEIVNRKVYRYNENIPRQLSLSGILTGEFGGFESYIFLQPETGQQRNRKDDTQRRDMRRYRLRKLNTEY